jgi:hypothetical protein
MTSGGETMFSASFHAEGVGALAILDMDHPQLSETPCQALKGVAASSWMKTMPPLSGTDRLIADAGADGVQRPSISLEKYAQQLARIESALARMESGRYGFCTGCDSRIPLTRLRADPATETCADCKEPATLTV